MNKKSAFLIAPALALGAMALSVSPALAADNGASYQANLQAINGSGASGTVMVSVNGNQATVTEKVCGLAATFNGKPYPHVQHIHIDGMGMCPTAAADTNGDGVISTTEGGPAYGAIGTTLSTSGDTSPAAGTDLAVAGMGACYTYQRTITLDAKTAASLRRARPSSSSTDWTRPPCRPRRRRNRATWFRPCPWRQPRRPCAGRWLPRRWVRCPVELRAPACRAQPVRRRALSPA